MEELLQSYWLWLIIIIWTLPWKGMALWRAARKGQKAWFVVLLIVNTLAILEILYLFVFSRKANRPAAGTPPPAQM
ncbi:MAG: DUF5652 family protein [Candidatus Veblenbacteria bacterium]|nr:DUF5652 family protein [Candidatus Veblenbacteria bacterium]